MTIRPLSLLAALAFSLALVACPQDGKKEGAKAPPAGDKAPASQPAGTKAPGGKVASAPPANASVRFAFPQPGSKVFESSQVAFGVSGMTVTPAGEAIEDKSKGHHHLVIDGAHIPAGQVVPMDDTHIHFGKGQTSTDVKLAPGKHKLTMQLADGAHMSYGEKLAASIDVEVVKDPATAPKVMFLEPKQGAKVKSPVKVKFGIEGMTVRPAGEDPLDKTTGHHHVIVDGKPIPLGVMVPKNDTHIHFGKGQTEAELKLAPGKHTLTMQLADGGHLSYGPKLSATITVEVE